MLCTNGKQTRLPNETGLFFICVTGKYSGNVCRFARMCNQTKEYVMKTDKNGKTCEDYTIK